MLIDDEKDDISLVRRSCAVYVCNCSMTSAYIQGAVPGGVLKSEPLNLPRHWVTRCCSSLSFVIHDDCVW
jgi:hypothetical protein